MYDPERPCEKCGTTNASATWCPGSTALGHVAGCECDGEHLHRRCARCGYEWLEACLDAEE